MKTETMESKLAKAYKAGLLLGKEDEDVMSDTRARLGVITDWRQQGAKRFVLANQLLTAFTHTDVPMDLILSEQKFPFPCFAIESHDAIPLLTLKSNGKDAHTIIVSRLIKDEDGFEGDSCLIVTVFTDGGGAMVIVTDGHSMADNVDGELMEICDEDNQAILSMVMNTVLYINDSENTGTSEHRSIKSKIGGKRVRAPFIYLHAPKSLSLPSEDVGSRIDCRFMVRGHYRNQAHGEKRALRKLIWVHPFWKGPSLAEVVNKTYKVA